MITCRECLQQQGNTKVNERTTGKSLIIGTFHSIEKFGNLKTLAKFIKFLENLRENPKISTFLKFEPFNQKFRDENRMEQKFPATNFRKVGYTGTL